MLSFSLSICFVDLRADGWSLRQQRVAVKEEEQTGPMHWNDPLTWRDGLPIEVSMHEQIRKIEPPCPYLMPSLGYRLNLKQRRFRLYLPYQPGGDAKDLRKMDEHAPPSVPYHAPSLDFIFYTFLAMTEACLALDSGWWGDHQPSEAEMMENNCRKEGWVPIVHRDIKSRNTFLGEPGGDRDQRWSMVRHMRILVGEYYANTSSLISIQRPSSGISGSLLKRTRMTNTTLKIGSSAEPPTTRHRNSVATALSDVRTNESFRIAPMSMALGLSSLSSGRACSLDSGG